MYYHRGVVGGVVNEMVLGRFIYNGLDGVVGYIFGHCLGVNKIGFCFELTFTVFSGITFTGTCILRMFSGVFGPNFIGNIVCTVIGFTRGILRYRYFGGNIHFITQFINGRGTILFGLLPGGLVGRFRFKLFLGGHFVGMKVGIRSIYSPRVFFCVMARCICVFGVTVGFVVVCGCLWWT